MLRLLSRVLQSEAARVVDDPTQRGFDEDYRLSSDPGHVIRVNQRPPKGLPAKLRGYVHVAGVSQPERRKAAAAFIAGRNRYVELERAPFEGHPEAISVIGTWEDDSGQKHRAQLGWLPADVAAEIPPDLPIGATVEVLFRPRLGKSPGIRLDVWRLRRGRQGVSDH